jgi:sortase (surface protein transpeptidase)
VLKKAGIVVAAAAAGLLAVSPLAFAGDFKGESDHHHHHHSSDHDSDNNDHDSDQTSCKQKNSATDKREGGHGGLINVSDIAVQVPIQACNNSVIEGVLGILAKDQKNDDSHGSDN